MSMIPGCRGEVIERWLSKNPDLDDRTMSVVGCFKLIHEALERASERACEQQELSPAELEVLVPLRHSNEQVTGAKLARDLGMTRAGVAKHLKRLEQRELLQRSSIPGDRRSTSVALTPRGEHAVDQTFGLELAEHARLLRPVFGDTELYDAVVKIAGLIAEPAEAGLDEGAQ